MIRWSPLLALSGTLVALAPAVLTLAVTPIACSQGNDYPSILTACIPGSVGPCECSETPGSAGSQTCNSAGTGFGECGDCSHSPIDAGADSAADATVDAGADSAADATVDAGADATASEDSGSDAGLSVTCLVVDPATDAGVALRCADEGVIVFWNDDYVCSSKSPATSACSPGSACSAISAAIDAGTLPGTCQ
jgi:hypothetical protein